jgi:dual-specificity kinase/CDC-like kinase
MRQRAGVVSAEEDGMKNKDGGAGGGSPHDDTVGHFRGGRGTVIADRYRVLGQIGIGTFGRVLECMELAPPSSSSRRGGDRRSPGASYVAIKVVRDVKRYYESALIEARIMRDINRRGCRGLSHCVVLLDAFTFRGHYCLVMESLGPSLYDFLKGHDYKPFPMVCIQDFAVQLLETLQFLHSFRLIHTDLKMENICLTDEREVMYENQRVPQSTRIKIIDFGGACYDTDKKSSVVNTRQYRAPEVILGTGWSMPSDMWSAGCILAELYQGELLFPTHDNVEHLALIERIIGLFPRQLLRKARKTSQLAKEAFDTSGEHRMENVLSEDSLDFVKTSRGLSSLVREQDTWFLDLLRRMLRVDPEERETAHECLRYLATIRRDVARYV